MAVSAAVAVRATQGAEAELTATLRPSAGAELP